MLDLKKLEEKLDLALSLETKESLSKWLSDKRYNASMRNLGEGEYLTQKETNSYFNVNIESDTFANENTTSSLVGDNRFALAA